MYADDSACIAEHARLLRQFCRFYLFRSRLVFKNPLFSFFICRKFPFSWTIENTIPVIYPLFQLFSALWFVNTQNQIVNFISHFFPLDVPNNVHYSWIYTFVWGHLLCCKQPYTHEPSTLISFGVESFKYVEVLHYRMKFMWFLFYKWTKVFWCNQV